MLKIKTSHSKPKVFQDSTTLLSAPKSLKEILKILKWHATMQTEYDVFIRYITWVLVDTPTNKRLLVTCVCSKLRKNHMVPLISSKLGW